MATEKNKTKTEGSLHTVASFTNTGLMGLPGGKESLIKKWFKKDSQWHTR